MLLSDISVTRPVLAAVMSLLLVAFGLISFTNLSLREYPDIDPPVVSIEVEYPGASANIVETRITEIIEDRISGVEGIRFISSTSSDGESSIDVEFEVGRDIEAAANDIRDRVSGVMDNLPEEADPPDIRKADSSDDVILWLNLTSEDMTTLELTDYARRYLQDRFSVLPGVARVRVGGGLEYAMRVWIDRNRLAARDLTVADVEAALRSENIELPAGSIESEEVQFTARIERSYQSVEDFRALVVDQGENYLVRLGDVARVEIGAVENRTFFRGNNEQGEPVPMVGLGIIKQSRANTVDVSEAVAGMVDRVRQDLPEGMFLHRSYDSSVFIRDAVAEVYKTLFIAMVMVVTVIYLFLGSWRAMLVPAVTVPVSLVGTFIALYAFGFSLNLLTLLALVLAIGLVVDDAIVVLENIARRVEEGEPPLTAAFNGTRQVSFAVIATTLVLVAVFVPITFLEGDLGRLFTEFSITMAAAVCFSTFVAVTLCPVLASKLLRQTDRNGLSAKVDAGFTAFRDGYVALLQKALKARVLVAGVFVLVIAGSAWMMREIPTEYAPREDRGAFFLIVNGPEGASYDYMVEYMDEIERRMLPLVHEGQVKRLLVRAPRAFGTISSFNSGIVIVVLEDWSERRSAFELMGEVSKKLADLPGIRAFPVMRQGFGGGISKPVQFVIGGGSYEQLAEWRDIVLAKLDEDNPGLTGIDTDYKETSPQLSIRINRDRAGDLGVSVETIGRTLQTMLGSRQVTTWLDDGEEYDVIVEGERDEQRTPTDMENIYVRSDTSGRLIPLSNLVDIREYADSGALNRYNRIRAITIEASLAEGLALGDALDHLREIVRSELPAGAVIDYKGESLDLQTSGDSLLFVFMLGFAVVFLVLAAQFESFVHPLVIILTVPMAIGGALAGIWLTGGSLNVYTQIGLIMLVGLSAKNGILIVEFANQLRDGGTAFRDALLEASATRLRPIVMTGITTVAGSLPLILSFGAGAETRVAIGVVILSGVAASVLFTLFVVPVAYDLLARGTGSPGDVRRQLEHEQSAMQAGE